MYDYGTTVAVCKINGWTVVLSCDVCACAEEYDLSGELTGKWREVYEFDWNEILVAR